MIERWRIPQGRIALRHVLLSLVFFAFYFLLNRPEVIILSHLGSIIWYPAVGLFLALMLGISPWYGVVGCLADLVVGRLLYHQPIFTITGLVGGIGMASSYTAAAYVLRGPWKIDLRLRKRQDVVRYVAVTSLAAATSSLFGVASLAADGSIPWSQYWQSLPSWFLNDQIGLLAVAPCLLIYVLPWVRRQVLCSADLPIGRKCLPQTTSSVWRVGEGVGQVLALPAVVWVMFGNRFGHLQLFYLTCLPVIWIAMRHGIKRVVIAVLALDVGIVVALHYVPLTPTLLAKTVLLMFVVSATGLILGSAVSERQRVAVELYEQSAYLDSLIRNSPLGIVVLDRDGRIELTNNAFVDMFLSAGINPVGRHLTSIFPLDSASPAAAPFPELFLGPHTTQQMVQRQRHDGEMLTLEASTVPVIGNDVVRGVFTIYKDITAQIRVAEVEREHATSLRHFVKEMEVRARQMTVLNEMGNLLECCTNVEEAAAAVVSSLQRLSPDALSGSLDMFRSSRNLLEPAGCWGAEPTPEKGFPPDACWALRRGQPHWSGGVLGEPTCSHLSKFHSGPSLCVPMVAQGNTLGILQLEFVTFSGLQQDEDFDTYRGSRQILISTAAAQIGLSLATLQLRETLRDQTIRDPLTGLFNRRFLQESLFREVTRAGRKNTPLSVLFVDIDHFKRFNDTFGHDAGDYVLRSLADVLRTSLRSDDIACRFGGEEFAFVLPECSGDDAVRRANSLRLKVKELALQHRGELLGSITLSVGVATYPSDSTDADELLKIADTYLYQSKASGRDRVTAAPSPSDSAATASA